MSVYFAIAGDYMKIGYSWNPISRASTITTNCARPDDLPRATEVDLIGWVPGGHHREAEFHAKFADKRVAGEWFRGISRDEAAALVWDDPRGCDIQRMSAMAVFAAVRYPNATRDDIEAAGITVLAVSEEEGMRRFNEMFSREAREDGAA